MMFVKILCFSGLLAFLSPAFALPPKHLITHNNTKVESNAYIGGTVPSQYPTKAQSQSTVFWTAVRIGCFGHVVNNQCTALIKMETNTSTPIEIGTLTLNLETGDINPKFLSANGYTITVNNPGETTLNKVEG